MDSKTNKARSALMNEKGNILIIIFIIMIGIIILLPLGMFAFKPLDIIVRVILIFVIFPY